MTARVAKDQLKSYVERIERLEEEKKSIADDIKDVYGEAKGNGFDVKALRAVVRLRREDLQKRLEFEAVLETYLHALGMLKDTPLGRAAMERDLRRQADELLEIGDRLAANSAKENETKVSIAAGGKTIETTSAGLQQAAEFVKSPAGRRAMRKQAKESSNNAPQPAETATTVTLDTLRAINALTAASEPAESESAS